MQFEEEEEPNYLGRRRAYLKIDSNVCTGLHHPEIKCCLTRLWDSFLQESLLWGTHTVPVGRL